MGGRQFLRKMPFLQLKAELKLQIVPSNTQQYKRTKCGAWFVKTWYGGTGGGTYSIGTGGIADEMDKR